MIETEQMFDSANLLPTPDDYQIATDVIVNYFENNGGPRDALAKYHEKMMKRFDYAETLRLLSLGWFIHLEATDCIDEETSIESRHIHSMPMARALLRGFELGEMIAAAVHPAPPTYFRRVAFTTLDNLVPEYSAESIKQLGGIDTFQGIELATSEIAKKGLSRLKEQTLLRIQSFSTEIIPSSDHAHYFTIGAGVSLAKAYEYAKSYPDKEILQNIDTLIVAKSSED